MKIKIGIVGYGNVGRGVHQAILQNPDMELVAIFTRRNPDSVKTHSDAKVDLYDNLANYERKNRCAYVMQWICYRPSFARTRTCKYVLYN